MGTLLRDNFGRLAWQGSTELIPDLSEQISQALINQAMPDAFFVHDHWGRIVEVNDKACAGLGYERSELLSMTIMDIEQDFDLASAQAEWSRIQPGGTGVIFGHQRRNDGTIFPVEVHLGLLELEGERFYIGVVRGITKRQRALDVLQRSEARFQGTFEQAAVGIAMVALDGSWLRVNHRLCDIVGYSHAEMLQKTFQEITHPEDLGADLDCIRRLLAQEIDTYSMEKRYIRKDGETIWVKLTGSLVWSADGKPDYFIAIVEDIQSRKLAEAEAIRSASHFRKVFDHATTAIAITDWKGRFYQCNPAYTRLLGYSDNELARMDFTSLVHPDDREANLVEIRRLQAGEVPSFEIENRYVNRAGEAVWVRKFVSVLPDNSGKPAFLLALVTDISEYRASPAGAKLPRQVDRAANAAKGALVCDYIESNLDRPINLAELEQLSGLSRRSLQYTFQRHYGCTPMQWIRNGRLDRANRLLKEASHGATVTKIALECGFSRLGAFSHDYLARFGELPSTTLKRGKTR